MENLEQIRKETKEIILKEKYPEIFKQLEKLYLIIEHQQKEITELENKNKEFIYESGKKETKLIKIEQILKEQDYL